MGMTKTLIGVLLGFIVAFIVLCVIDLTCNSHLLMKYSSPFVAIGTLLMGLAILISTLKQNEREVRDKMPIICIAKNRFVKKGLITLYNKGNGPAFNVLCTIESEKGIMTFEKHFFNASNIGINNDRFQYTERRFNSYDLSIRIECYDIFGHKITTTQRFWEDFELHLDSPLLKF
ncbi:hypothetical protein ACFLT7_02925 [candidate division KSB1 bacterium]